ncbi:MAG: hypothetical protein IT305_17460 [Chloroflexi bacterium]|nr:hypothetical protein [Chloroflexota bacterium]
MIVRRAARRAALILAMLLVAPAGSLPAYAAALPGIDMAGAPAATRQMTYPAPGPGAEWPSSANTPQDIAVPAPYDAGLINLTFHELPDSIQADQEFTIGADVPAGATCSGTIDYLDGPTQPLVQTPAMGDVCWWTVIAPATLRPGHATVTIDVAQSGQARELVGVISVGPPPL